MKDFKHYYENAEEEMEPAAEPTEPAAEPATEEPPMEDEGETAPGPEETSDAGVSIKLKDSVFIDGNGNLVVQLVSGKTITPDEYLQKYLPALLTAAKYQGK